jgi:putative endonuclease
MNSQHIQVGQLGEAVADKYLTEQGYILLERNYRQKWGEIDLIVQKDITVHFIEVKTVSYKAKADMLQLRNDGYRPEEHVTQAKYDRLARTIATWLQQERYKGHYQLDLVTVHLVPSEMYAQVAYYENIFLD